MTSALRLSFTIITSDGATTYGALNGDLMDKPRCIEIAKRLESVGCKVKVIETTHHQIDIDPPTYDLIHEIKDLAHGSQ